MPNNSQFTINNFSPNFRDALLGRNLLADSIKNNSLAGLLYSVNKPAGVANVKGDNVQASPDIEVQGEQYRQLNTVFNKINKTEYWKNTPIIYLQENVGLIPVQQTINSPTNNGEFWREGENTIFNVFRLGKDQYYGSQPVKYDEINITTNTELTDKNIKKNPEDDGVFRRELNVTQNQYKSTNYERVDIQLLPFEVNSALATVNLDPNEYNAGKANLESYTETGVQIPFTSNISGDIRQFNTTKNIYLDVDKQSRISLDYKPVPTFQRKSYLDENNNLNYGDGFSIQVGDVLGSLLTGGGVGFDPNSGNPVPDFDVRSSLAGRALTSTGALGDTRLGQISPQYLAAAVGNNIAFNIQEETIGRLNTNPLSLLTGGDLIVPNNKITVGDGLLGGATDLLERMTGAKIPVSLLPAEADLFTFSQKSYIGVGNIQRANAMIANTGEGQIVAMFANINSNINPNLIGTRQGYAPGYQDDRLSSGIIRANGIGESEPYAFSDGEGGIQDFQIISDENTPMAQSSYKLEGLVSGSGFGDGPNTIFGSNILTLDNGRSKFIWSDANNNKLARDADALLNGNDFKTKKTLLHRTQELFNSNKMRTLVNGRGLKVSKDEITTTNLGFMSKGSGVLVNGGRDVTSETNPDKVFARAWSPVDRYDQYKDLQKHTALTKDGRADDTVDIDSSVLGDFGIVKIGPHKGDEIKKFMFSIENLAWDGETNNLLDCEVGPGDPLSGNKGRIMWFPPYDMVFNESTSVNWDRNDFIGRGEPLYTYNNTERTGSLSWKIVIDHPNYLNFMRDRSDEEISAFFAGALEIEEIRNRVLSANEKAMFEVKSAQAAYIVKENADNNTFNTELNVYFLNDDETVPTHENIYENGTDENGTSIDYQSNPGDSLNKKSTTVSPDGITYPDNTDFGLNVDWYKISKDIDTLTAFLNKGGECEFCRINITGYASQQGNQESNEALARNRAEEVKDWFLDNVFIYDASDADSEKRFRIHPSQVITNSGCRVEETISGLNNLVLPGSSVDNEDCKRDRRVTISIEYDTTLKNDEFPLTPLLSSNEPPRGNLVIPKSRFYTECDYFEKVDSETKSFATMDIKNKIRNFSPAFHAITPEGFNSRLTFLQQCTRQGPTRNLNKPDNLVFGKPPVCILRIGDFYNTKIIIDSLNIDYEPLVWDLNPEGVGVQPMIANITMSFAFIGGSSLKGPINRLQNAVSFNYFANTELYDPRAERIRKKTQSELENGPDPSIEYTIQDGTFPNAENRLEDSEKYEGLTNGNVRVEDMVDVAERENRKQAEEEAIRAEEEAASKPNEDNDKEILSAIRMNSYQNSGEFGGFLLEINANKTPDVRSAGLSEQYFGEVFITDSLTNEVVSVGQLSVIPIDDTSFTIEAQSHDGKLDEIIINLNNNPNTVGSLSFTLFNHPQYDSIMSKLEPCRVFTDSGSKPCPGGDNKLTMELLDGFGFTSSSKLVYNETNNG